MDVSLNVISSARQLRAIQDEWASLVSRYPRATVFQRPELATSKVDYSGTGQLWTLAFRQNGTLVGLLPMFLHDWDGRRQLTLMGNGVSDHLDMLAQPEFAQTCARLAYAFLEEHASDWDVCDWQDLPASSELLASANGRFLARVSGSIPCASVALPGTRVH
jgi:CelD/BcsL family acetyltransferase involved in cellulose biosynthesis